jgi:clan AA aspartic protease (TIGR02281 family)
MRSPLVSFAGLGLILAFCFAANAPLRGQDITIDGVARTASLFRVIRNVCPQFYAIDAAEAHKYEMATSDIGIQIVGESKFRAILKDELARRNNEVKVTGPAQWCGYQRDHQQALGVNVFLETTTSPVGPKTTTADHPKIAVTRNGGTFAVPVEINGRITLDFIIDSGASDVSIPADVFSTLMRTGTIKESDITGTQTYAMADGSQSQSRTFLLRSLNVGGRMVENVKGRVAPAQGDLLLGQSFLGRFRSWSIDNKTNELLLND